MPEDPDDIGYIRKSNGSEFAYDNNIPKETMTVDEEIKAPNQVYHLKTSDLQQNAGQELQKNGNTQAQDDNTVRLKYIKHQPLICVICNYIFIYTVSKIDLAYLLK